MHNMTESRTRSLTKAFTWRVVGTITTIIVSYIVTGSIHFALSIGLAEIVAKMIVYYIHERAWTKILWGRNSNSN